MCSNSSLKSLSQLKTKFTWDHHGIGEKIYSNDFRPVVVLYLNFVSPRGVGAFSGDFTINLARQCRAFSRGLKIEKFKAPLFRGPKGAGATNDWCINKSVYVYCLCVISRSSNDRLQLKEDLICPTKLNMDAKFVENIIFLRGIRE